VSEASSESRRLTYTPPVIFFFFVMLTKITSPVFQITDFCSSLRTIIFMEISCGILIPFRIMKCRVIFEGVSDQVE
jgi:hypothetical protein